MAASKGQNRKKKQKPKRRRPAWAAPAIDNQLSGRAITQYNEAIDHLNRGDYANAEQIALELDKQADRVEVVELLHTICMQAEKHEQASVAAYRLCKMAPRNALNTFLLAQSSMLCGRACMATNYFERFIETWPEHEQVPKAKEFLEITIPEAQRRVKKANLPEDGMIIFGKHEASIMWMSHQDFKACADLCEHVIRAAPDFVSPRNNLANALFYAGNLNRSIEVAKTAHQRFPESLYGLALLIKLLFVAGDVKEADRLADDLPKLSTAGVDDGTVACMETLALLGRDRELREFCKSWNPADDSDPIYQASKFHFLAYAMCRLGDTEGAEENWRKAVKAMPNHSAASANLTAMTTDEDHTPWPESSAKWIPESLIDAHARKPSSNLPAWRNLIGVLLDRGEPDTRRIALKLAKFDKSPEMNDVLHGFAFGRVGPLASRIEAATVLQERGQLAEGAHSIYKNGKFEAVHLVTSEVFGEPVKHPNPKMHSLLEKGGHAMMQQDFGTAEQCFQNALEIEPDDNKANYNLAALWLQAGDRRQRQDARSRIEAIYQRAPDYVFATVGIAQFVAGDGNPEKALDILLPLHHRKRMHISEAKALYAAESQILAELGEIEKAEVYMGMFESICDDKNDPQLLQLQRFLRRQTGKPLPRSLI